MREGEDAAGDAIGLLLHQLLLLLALLLQGSQACRLFLFQELPQLLKRLSDLLLRGLSLILTNKEGNESIQNWSVRLHVYPPTAAPFAGFCLYLDVHRCVITLLFGFIEASQVFLQRDQLLLHVGLECVKQTSDSTQLNLVTNVMIISS